MSTFPNRAPIAANADPDPDVDLRDGSRNRFFSKIQKTDGCWVWVGKSTNSYGVFWYLGKNRWAHRVSYQMHKGQIPEKLQIDHLCRNRLCVNPDHLEAVTPRENLIRGTGFIAVNAAKTHCKHGHPFTEENTYRQPVTQFRYCRACARRADRAHKERRRLAKLRCDVTGQTSCVWAQKPTTNP